MGVWGGALLIHTSCPLCNRSMGVEATNIYKRLASMHTLKWDSPYSSTLYWLRCCLAFSLLHSAIQAIRGVRSSQGRRHEITNCHRPRQHGWPVTLTSAIIFPLLFLICIICIYTLVIYYWWWHTHTHNIVVFCCVYALLYGICSSRTEHWHCWESDLVSEREKNWLSSQFSIFSPPFDDNRSLTRLNLAMNTSFSAPVWKGMSLKNWRLRKTLATSSLGGHHKNTIIP